MAGALDQTGPEERELMNKSLSVLRAADRRTPCTADFQLVLVSLLHYLLLCRQYEEAQGVYQRLMFIQESGDEERLMAVEFERHHYRLFDGVLSETIEEEGPWYVSLSDYSHYVHALYKKQVTDVKEDDSDVKMSFHRQSLIRSVMLTLQEVHLHRLTTEFLQHIKCMSSMSLEIFKMLNEESYTHMSAAMLQLIEELMSVTRALDRLEANESVTGIIQRTSSRIDDIRFKSLLSLTKQKVIRLQQYTNEPVYDYEWSSVDDLVSLVTQRKTADRHGVVI